MMKNSLNSLFPTNCNITEYLLTLSSRIPLVKSQITWKITTIFSKVQIIQKYQLLLHDIYRCSKNSKSATILKPFAHSTLQSLEIQSIFRLLKQSQNGDISQWASRYSIDTQKASFITANLHQGRMALFISSLNLANPSQLNVLGVIRNKARLK